MHETRTADASEQALAETAVGEGAASGPSRPSSDVPTAGDAIGRYVVIDVLGRGGMGVVLSAFDPELDRKIAVKLLRGGGGAGSTVGRQRLIREAQAMAKLSHPNVISVHDVGEWDGQVFVAMEFIDGQTLKDWASEPREWGEVVAMYAQAAAGLEAAHKAGIVHRDFKPDNCMVDGAGRLRVLDFGLASDGAPREPGEADGDELPRPHGKLGDSTPSLTQTGAVMGTPAYMAPEQHLGQPTSARSDQFSFCVALYGALYRERPFAGETPTAVMFNVLKGRLKTPDNRGKAPAWLFRALARGMALAPEERWPSMSELIDALERPARIRQNLRRLGALAAVGAVVAGGFVVSKVVERRRAEAAEQEREREAQHRLDQLLPGFERMVGQGDAEQAFRSMESFARLDDVRETRAVSAGWLALGVALQESESDELGLQASANAFAAAPSEGAQQEVLATLVEPFLADRRWASLQAVLSRLDEQRMRDPKVKRARIHSAFVDGKFSNAKGIGAHSESSEIRSLRAFSEALSQATLTPIAGENPVSIARFADGKARVVEVDGSELIVREGTGALPELSRRELPVEGVKFAFPLHGTDSVLVRAPIKGSQEHRSFFVGRGEVQEARADLGSLVAVASGDLDADGVPDHFGAVTYPHRQLAEFERLEGVWRTTYPHPPTNNMSSDINDVAVGDFDGDGRQELAVGLGAWAAYMLRVLRANERTGELEHVASLELGSVRNVSAVRDGERTRLFIHKINTGKNPLFFSEQQPYGPYEAGLYEVRLDDDQLEVVGEYPENVAWARTYVVDIDGDGRDELAAPTGRGSVVFTLDGDWMETEAFRLLDVGNLDDDAAGELLVRHDDEVYVLGAGDEAMPSVERTQAEPPSEPEAIGQEAETIRGVWERGETLAEIGLAPQAVSVFEGLAPLCSTEDARAAAVKRAAELAERSVSPERALEVFEVALRGTSDWSIAEPAAALAETMHEFERAEQLWQLAPDGDDKRAALARLESRTAEPVTVLSARTFLAAGSKFGWPGALSFRRGTGVMLAAPAGEGELFRTPLEVTGDFVSVEVDADWTMSDWGSGIWIRLVGEDGTSVASAKLVSNGGASGIRRLVRGAKGVHTAWDSDVDDRDELSLRLDILGTSRFFRVEGPSSLVDRRDAPTALEPGRYDLVIESVINPDIGPLISRFEFRSIRVRGARLVDHTVDPRSEQLRLAALGDDVELDEVEPGDAATALWVALEHERRGDRAAAVAQLSGLDAARSPEQWELALRLDAGRFAPLLHAHLGDAVWTMWARSWRLVGYQHPESLEMRLAMQRLPDDLDDVVPSADAKALLLWWRGRMHLQRGELVWARRDLERAVELSGSALDEDGGVAGEELRMAHGASCQLLAKIERSRDDEDAARVWEDRYVARSTSPATARRRVERLRTRSLVAEPER